MDHNPNKKFIRQAADGDTAAFDDITKIYLADVYRYLVWLTKDAQKAEDITQDTFVKAWRSIQKSDTARPFLPWLLRIARNCAFDFFRKKVITPFSALTDHEQHFFLRQASSIPTPDETARQNERAQLVQAILNTLSANYREVIVLHYLEGLSVPEVAQVLNLSQETARTRLRRARALFRESLERHENNTMAGNIEPSLAK